MKYLVFLSLVALTIAALSGPCTDCYVVTNGDEEFGAAVHLLTKTLANLAATKEGPFFNLVKAYSVTILNYYAYPTVTADLIDQENKVERCDIKLFKPLDFEDFTTEYDVIFYCKNSEITRHVNMN